MISVFERREEKKGALAPTQEKKEVLSYQGKFKQ